MSKRGATLFSGGRGVEALLRRSIDFVFAVEYDPAIAAVGAQFGGHTFVASVCDVDYSTWGALDYLHASPVCKEFSQAKTGGKEGDLDIQSALAVARCLEATAPRVFTLENVGQYQRSQSYRLICQALDRLGYMWHAEVLNSADFGVPQTRRRLILRAVKDALLPGLAAPDRWVGWYAAIEDIIDTLPASKFADWQLSRLGGMDSLFGRTPEQEERLEESIRAHRSFIVHSTDQRSMPVRDEADPAFTVMSFGFKDSHMPGGQPRAFIVSNAATEYGDGIRSAAEPCHSITAQANGRTRAWLVGDQAAAHGEGVQLAEERAPAFTLTTRATGGAQPRAWLQSGRVVRMTPRALARFQSIPDSYVLPERSSLACTIIGNAVPSLMMQKIVEPLV